VKLSARRFDARLAVLPLVVHTSFCGRGAFAQWGLGYGE
jgi:hypothetical protein